MNSSAPAGRPWPWKITRDCRVVVRAPRRLSQARIDDFVASHAGWIARHLEQQRRRAALAPSAPTQAEIGALKEKARQVLPPKIAYYSEKMGLFPTGVRITSARTRYGSCSGKNSLCFSCFLMNCPDAAMDLVVVHELCHIQVKNHGPDFYALLEQVLPDWREPEEAAAITCKSTNRRHGLACLRFMSDITPPPT